MRLLNQTHYDPFFDHKGHLRLCECVFSSWVCVPVRTHEWRLRDRFWLDWCPSPDESEILMCQQGWIMHAAPLPLFSTSCLQSFASLFITTATSEEIFTFIFSPPPPGLLPYANEVLLPPPPPPRSPLGQPCSPSEQLTRSYHRALQKFLLLKFRRISRWGACKHLRWKWPSALTCTARYQVTGGRRAAIDTGWQLHPWLTGVIRRIRLTDKRADKAGDKLTNQDLVKEGIPFVLKRPVRNVWQNNPCSSTAALGCSLRYFQLVE